MTEMQTPTKTADVGQIVATISFLSSVIKSGEEWSAECEAMVLNALQAVARLAGDAVVREPQR